MSDGVLKYGDASDAATRAALDNFAGAGLSGLSLCTTPIELLSNDGSGDVVGTATGFFWLKSSQPHLVTNYHVASGRNPFTGELNSNMGYIPRQMAFYGSNIEINAGIVRFSRRRWVINFDEDFPAIMEKPPTVSGAEVDIWGIPLAHDIVFAKDSTRKGFTGSESGSCFVNEHSERPIVTSAGDDCFILGYPLDNYEGGMFPIWKRGSISTDTNIGVGGRPIFLVDAAVTPSMSGSPIFRKATTFTAENKDIGAIQEFTTFQFIGVYAGRLESAKLNATNIGYAWYKTKIDGAIDYYNYKRTASASPAV